MENITKNAPGFSFKAILVGVAVDIGGSLALSVALSIVLLIVLLSQQVPQANLENEAKRLAETVPMGIVSILLGSACTFAGGLLAAWIAPRRKLLHAALVGIIGTAIGVPFVLNSPPWYLVTVILVTTPVAMLGGMLIREKKKADDAEDFYE